MSIEQLLQNTVVIPVVVIDDPDDAVPLATTFLEAGINLIEITLRTQAALEAMTRITTKCSDIAVGAGSVVRSDQVTDIINAGASFAVSPGFSESLLSTIERAQLPYIPGAATASETLHLLDRGYVVQKFFPAEQAGGTSYLKSIAGPISDVKFIPTGGINVGNAANYLALSNVLCVGGSWVAPNALLNSRNFKGIGRIARSVSQMRR